MNNIIKELTTEKITRTVYEITCAVCGQVWRTNHADDECPKCRRDRAERQFQERYSHLIGARVTAVIRGEGANEQEIKSVVICDEEGDYWRLTAEKDYDYGAYIEADGY